ncbi:MAG: HypC/HybG/HupF family hydrogenase formation chaperone [Actinomycetota bacterium]|nr:HypC/HybG/HupF family hydrogenase formation chaperone [Actinomycetota bacterium]
MCQHRLQRVVARARGASVVTEDLDGVTRDVSLLAFAGDEPAVGEWLLVHSGYALERVDEREATATVEELAAAGRARREVRTAVREVVEQTGGEAR